MKLVASNCEFRRPTATRMALPNPQRNLHETVVFNLSTLYDLHSEGSAAKKRALGDLVERYGGETFAHSMLKPREGSS